jgi:tape measure domain-containing protein
MDLVENSYWNLHVNGKPAITSITEVEKKIDDLKAKQADLTRGTKEYAAVSKEIREVKKELETVRKEYGLQGMTVKQLEDYQRQLRREIKATTVGTAAYIEKTKEFRAVQERLDGVRTDMRAVRKTAEESQSTWQQLKGWILAAFTVAALIEFGRQLIDLGKRAFGVAIDMDRMHVALKNVSKTSEEYRINLKFLSELSDKYGQDLGVLTGAYTKFLASSNSTNLSLGAKQKIYQSIIKAGSALTLSNAEIEGSLLAVSQMFSKGNVSAEELRGQLGERLPGAFGIMADALGVSEKQLNKMLEQGEVLAEDALPKFAAALEKTYGAAATANVEQYGGAMNRVVLKVTEWIVKQNESIGFTRALASGLNFVADNFRTLVSIVKNAVVAVVAYQVATRAAAAATLLKNGYMVIQRLLVGEVMLAHQSLTGKIIVQTAAQTAATSSARAFNAALTANPIGLVIAALGILYTAYEAYSISVEDAQEKQNELNNRLADAIVPLREEQAEFTKLTDAVLDGNAKLEDREAALTSLKEQYPEQMKGIDNLKDAEKKLGSVIRTVNADFVTRHKLLGNEVRINVKREEFNTSLREQIKLENELLAASHHRTTMVTGTAGLVQTFKSEAENIQENINLHKKRVSEIQKGMDVLAAESEKYTKKLNYNYVQQNDAEGNKTKVTAAEIKARAAARAKDLKEEEKELLKRATDITKLIQQLDKAKIESETDEVLRNKKKLMSKFEDELAAFEELTVTQEQYATFERDLKIKLVRDIEEIDDKAAAKKREAFDKQFETLEKEFKVVIKFAEEEHKKKRDLSEAELKMIKGVQTKRPELTEAAALKVGGIEKRLSDQIIKFHRKNEASHKESIQKQIEEENRKQQVIALLTHAVGAVLEAMYRNVENQIELATTETEKAALRQKKAWLDVGAAALTAVGQFTSGNVVGGIVSGIGALFGALNNWVNKSSNLMEARLADLRAELEAAGKQFLEITNGFTDAIDPAKIEAAYEGLFKLSQIEPVRMDLGEYDSFERRINQEMDIANAINENYDTAIKREDEYSKQVIANIETAYSTEVNRINDKYDLLDTKANQRLDADTLSVRENQTAELAALIANEDAKESVFANYNARKANIMKAFALADQEITADTDEATIKAINDSIAARDKALNNLQTWINTELEYMVDSEGQKRKEISATEKIALDADLAVSDLNMKSTAAAIQRTKDKNIELVTAENAKNKLLENEASRVNGVLETLGRAKDTALAESFTILKELISVGYDEMIQKALDAFNAGKLTAEQYNEIAAKLFQIQGQINGMPKFEMPNFDFDFRVPRFAAGTEYVDKNRNYESGTDKVPAWLNRGERVLTAEQNSLLGGMTNSELIQRTISSMGANSYANNSGMIEKIRQSALYRNGAAVVNVTPQAAASNAKAGEALGGLTPSNSGELENLLRELNLKVDNSNGKLSEQLAAMCQYISLLSDVKRATNRAADANNMRRNDL